MNAIASRRRHPAFYFALLILGLVLTGGLYAIFSPKPVDATATVSSSADTEEGRQLFITNCASCHGTNAEGMGDAGPSLVGVGAASVDFQMGTGRMPLPGPNVQAQRNKPMFSDEEIAKVAAYIQSLGAGPAVPDEKYTQGDGNASRGKELFSVNCAMCHNSSAKGGALTRGKYAPTLHGVDGKHIYEAMETGPQNMPKFPDGSLTPEDKKDIITYVKSVEAEANPGGHSLGSLGPVGDALFVWTLGIGLMIGAAVWLGKKAS